MDTILIFGGNSNRLTKGIELAKKLPESFLILSSGQKRSEAEKELRESAIAERRYYLDYEALDTLSNMTANFDRIKRLKTKNLYLVSDHWHMPRIRAAAKIIFACTGIKLKEYPLPGGDRKESSTLVKTDQGRALLWKTTGVIFFPKEVQNRKKDLIKASRS